MRFVFRRIAAAALELCYADNPVCRVFVVRLLVQLYFENAAVFPLTDAEQQVVERNQVIRKALDFPRVDIGDVV